ncbi:MAG: hypothetical protein EB015_04525 [Methylocystaceae bacterium]|jgi:hypothetical protein|nr:hypothetical protein [Methylocystaceae bacterium]NDB67267.1 hypothetical protein [Methylocystaceae bacterium]
MRLATLTLALALSASPALACSDQVTCEADREADRAYPLPGYNAQVIAPVDPEPQAPRYQYQPRNCVTNYGGGGVAVTSCF